jgi:DNA-directed RNA polymerase subunit RPC12/RpoP
MKNIKSIIGIVLCTWYFPAIAFLAVITGALNKSSFIDLLFPIVMFLSYIFGIIFLIPKRIKKEIGTIEKKVDKLIDKKVDDVLDKKSSLIVCWKCKTEYQFLTNKKGDTVVQCPKCGTKGKIRK